MSKSSKSSKLLNSSTSSNCAKTPKQAIFIAATGQNVGKTTLCLGILAGLKKRFETVGFIKPVGQYHVMVDGDKMVDKDAVLFKNHFGLKTEWSDMSPVIIPQGFTRGYLDQRTSEESLLEKITHSFDTIASKHRYTVVEGTGHTGVGSIIGLNNVRVAAALGLEMVIIVSGGLGSAIDELALNLAICEKYALKVRGVILNRVLDEKREMLLEYFPKALCRWGVPLLGCVPYNAFLNSPTMGDFEALFTTQLISGSEHRQRHFSNFRLAAGSLETYFEDFHESDLVITPASREEIIEAVIERVQGDVGGMILTGRHLPSQGILEKIQQSNLPILYAPMCSYDAMKKLTSHVAKIGVKDVEKIEQAIGIVEDYVNFDRLCDL